MIPISVVTVDDEAQQLVIEAMRTGRLAQGPMVARLERDFAELIGVRHAVAVSSGTIALVAAMQALHIRPGQEVITSPFTFVATLNAILEAGATARFADIRADDFCIDPNAVAGAVTDRTAVLMPVHLYGQPADMTSLAPLAERHGLHIVEDAAQSHGARIGDRAVGTFGLGCFSLYGTKNISTGEGGLVTTDDDELADRLRLLRNQGMRERYMYEVAGHNYRLTDLQAALAIPQIARYPEQVARRRHHASYLSMGLSDVPGLVVPHELPGRTHVWHQYTVLVTEEASMPRDQVVAELNANGVGCGIYYPRIVSDYACYRDDPRVIPADTPVAAKVATQCLSLPVHQHLLESDLDRIIEMVRKTLGA